MLHIVQRHAGLLPDGVSARARAISWMFAALNTMEPPILELQTARFMEADQHWSEKRLPLLMDRIRRRLDELAARLGDCTWLDGVFSGGDLLTVHALLRLKPSGLLDEYPSLATYVARGEARRLTCALSRPNWRSSLAEGGLTNTRLEPLSHAAFAKCSH